MPIDKCQNNWIKYSTALLFKLYSLSPNYNNPIYKCPSECEYKDVIINSSWTQNQMSENYFIKNSQSQNIFNQTQINDIPIYHPTQSAIDAISTPITFKQTISNNNDVMPPPKMRFKKIKTSDDYVLQYLQIKRKERSYKISQVEESNKKVKLFKKYREGELPDLNISLSDIIEPLICLIQKDNVLSNLVFEEYIKSLFNTIDKKNDKIIKIKDIVIKHMNILYTNPSFVKVLFNIIEVIKIPSINYSFLTTMSLNNQVIYNGILVLENLLEKNDFINNDDKISVWCELYNLYKSIGEEILLVDIQSQWCSKLLTVKALNYEIEGDYSNALTLYEECLDHLEANDWDDKIQPSAIETDYWYKERLKCMYNLQQWDDLIDNINSEIDNDNKKLWNNENQYMIPYYIKSLLRKGDNIINLQYI